MTEFLESLKKPDRAMIHRMVEQARRCLSVAMREAQGFEWEDAITRALAVTEEALDEIEKRDTSFGLDARVIAAGSTDQGGTDSPPVSAAVGRRGNCASGVRPALSARKVRP